MTQNAIPATPRRSFPTLLVALLLVLAAVLVAGGVSVFVYVKNHQYLVIDEWECSHGEAPYISKQGGSACAKVGARLPKGAHWDPLGNRPLDCNNRPGWIVIVGTNKRGDGLSSCYPDDEPIPKGWHR